METSDENVLKEELQKSADSYKAQLEVEVGESLEQIEKVVKTASIIAGGALLGYTVFKIFFQTEDEETKSKKKKRKRSRSSGLMDPVIKAGAEIATSFLLAMARRKLIEYINSLDQTVETTNGHSTTDQ